MEYCVFSRIIGLGKVKKKAGFLEKEGDSIEFRLQPNGLHPIETARCSGHHRLFVFEKSTLVRTMADSKRSRQGSKDSPRLQRSGDALLGANRGNGCA
jgi:hypothetical protein